MHRTELVVAHVENDELISIYYSDDFSLPFVGSAGMQFTQGTSTRLWETDNDELSPSVERVIYNIDDEVLVYTFTIDQPLKSSFWHKIDGAEAKETPYMRYF